MKQNCRAFAQDRAPRRTEARFARTIAIPILLFAARAEAGNPAQAEQLFSDGKRLARLGNYREACLKFEESQKIDPGIGTEFNLADCHERIGKIASAWAEFLEVASLAHNAGQTEREEAARTRAKALEPRVQRLTIRAESRSSALEILRDGTPVGRAQWNTPMPVDPGEHRVSARAPGKIPWETIVPVRVEGSNVAIDVPILRDAPVAIEPPRARALPSKEGEAHGRGDTQRIVGMTMAGAGVVGLGIATGFGIASKNHRDTANDHCSGTLCDQTGVSERRDALSAGNTATVLLAVGGGALVTGAVLYFTAPSQGSGNEKRASVNTVPTVGMNSAGLSLRGTFD